MKAFSRIEFCNYKGKSYLEIVAVTPTGEVTLRRELEDYMLSDGVLQNVEDLSKAIKAEMNIEKMPAFELVIRAEGQFKTIVSLPTMSQSQSLSLYFKEMRERAKFEKFINVYNVHKHTLGYIYSTYFIPENVVKSMKILAKLLGSRVTTVSPYGFYLHKVLNTKRSFVHFHIRNGLCTMLLISEGELISTYDFTLDTAEDVERQFLLVMSKHEFEFEHKAITHYAIDSDVEMELDLGLEQLALEDIPSPEPVPEVAAPTEKKKKSGLFGRKKKDAEPEAAEPENTENTEDTENTENTENTEAVEPVSDTAQAPADSKEEEFTFADQLTKELTEHLSKPEEAEEEEEKVPALVAAAPEIESAPVEQAPIEEIAENTEEPEEALKEEPEAAPIEEPTEPIAKKTEGTPHKKSLLSTIKSAFTRKKKIAGSIIRARADVELPTLDTDEDTITTEELEAKRKSLIARTKEATSDGVAVKPDTFRARFKQSTEEVRLEFAHRAREILKGDGMSYIVEEQATVFLHHGEYHSHIDIRNNEILYFTEE